MLLTFSPVVLLIRKYRALLKASLDDLPLRRNRLEKVLWSLVECGMVYVVVWVSVHRYIAY